MAVFSALTSQLRMFVVLGAILGLAVIGGAFAADPPSAHAGVEPPPPDPNCGRTIGPWEYVQLDADLTCSNKFNPALTVIGPAVLDLNGHTLTCFAPPNTVSHIGIEIEGWFATVKNGRIIGCHEGVVVEGFGYHRVRGLEITETLVNDTGIVVNSNRNRIEDNNVHDNDSTGILVNGNSNVIKQNTVHDNLFEVGEGISVVGNKNVVIWNTANNNGTLPVSNDGIDVSGDRNLVAWNTTNNNADDGIDVSGQNNTIILNNSSGNGGTDMEDGNTDCDGNVWWFNTFVTSNQPCIN